MSAASTTEAVSGSRRPTRGAASWYVYIVECADGSYYTGITTDVARREAEHNAGTGARYTRARRPVRMVYTEPAADRSQASQREWAIKQLPRPGKRRLADQHGERRGLEAGGGLTQDKEL